MKSIPLKGARLLLLLLLGLLGIPNVHADYYLCCGTDWGSTRRWTLTEDSSNSDVYVGTVIFTESDLSSGYIVATNLDDIWTGAFWLSTSNVKVSLNSDYVMTSNGGYSYVYFDSEKINAEVAYTVTFTKNGDSSGTLRIERSVVKTAYVVVNAEKKELDDEGTYTAKFQANDKLTFEYDVDGVGTRYGVAGGDKTVSISVNNSEVVSLTSDETDETGGTGGTGAIVIGEAGQYEVKVDTSTSNWTVTLTRQEIVALLTDEVYANGQRLRESPTLRLDGGQEVEFTVLLDDGNTATLYPAESVPLINGADFKLFKTGDETVSDRTVSPPSDAGTKKYRFSYSVNNADSSVTVTVTAADVLTSVNIVYWSSANWPSGEKWNVKLNYNEATGCYERVVLLPGSYSSVALNTNLGDFYAPESAACSIDAEGRVEEQTFTFSSENSSNNKLDINWMGWYLFSAKEAEDGTIALTVTDSSESDGAAVLGYSMYVVNTDADNNTTTTELPMTFVGGAYYVTTDLKTGDKVYFKSECGLYVYHEGGRIRHSVSDIKCNGTASNEDSSKFLTLYNSEGDNIDGDGRYSFVLYNYHGDFIKKQDLYEPIISTFKFGLRITKTQAELVDPEVTVHYGSTEDDGEMNAEQMNFILLRDLHECLLTLSKGDKIYFTYDKSGTVVGAATDTDKTFDEGLEDNPFYDLANVSEDSSLKYFVVGEDGNYRLSIVASSSSDGSTTRQLKVEKMEYPKKLYMMLTHDGTKGYIELLPMDNKLGVYASSAESACSNEDIESRLSATGKVSLSDGDTFYFNSDGSEAYEYGPANGAHGDDTSFVPGKDVRMYKSGDTLLNGNYASVTKPYTVESGTIKTENGSEIDNSYVMTVDIAYATNRTYSWGETANYAGDVYYLSGSIDNYGAVNNSPDENLRFVYHPSVGLYTLTVDKVYGNMIIVTYIDSKRNEDESYSAIPGNESITELYKPYDLWYHYDADGFEQKSTGTSAANYFNINIPEVASGVENLGGSDGFYGALTYENVTFVFDPSQNRLWVDVDKKESPGDIVIEDDPFGLDMNIVFVMKDDGGYKYFSHKQLTATSRTGYYVSGENGADGQGATGIKNDDASGWLPFLKTNSLSVNSGVDGKKAETYDATYYFFAEKIYYSDDAETQVDLAKTYERSVRFGSSLSNSDSGKAYAVGTASEWPVFFDNDYRNDIIESTKSNPDAVSLRRLTTVAVTEDKSGAGVEPAMFVSEADRKYFVEFDRSTTNVVMRLTRLVDDELYLVFDNVDLTGKEPTTVVKLIKQNDGFNYESEDYIDFLANGTTTPTSKYCHFFFSGKDEDNLHHIVTRSTNWHSKETTADKNTPDRLMEFDETTGLTDVHKMIYTAHNSFLNDVATKSDAAEAPSRVVARNFSEIGLNLFQVAPTDNTKYRYKVFVTLQGGEQPNTRETVDTDVVQLLRYDVTTGIEEIAAGEEGAARPAIRVEGGRLSVDGARSVSIYNLGGQCLLRSGCGPEVDIDVPAGIYIVVADGVPTKVLVD